MLVAVGQLGVDLVGDDQNIRALQHLGDSLQIAALHDAAGGVAGIGQHQRLGLGGDGRLQLLGSQTELVLRLRLHKDGRAKAHAGQRAIADKGRGGNDDLVAGFDAAAQRQI